MNTDSNTITEKLLQFINNISHEQKNKSICTSSIINTILHVCDNTHMSLKL